MQQSKDRRNCLILSTLLEKKKCHFKIRDLNFYLKSLEKKEQSKPKVIRREKVRTETRKNRKQLNR